MREAQADVRHNSVKDLDVFLQQIHGHLRNNQDFVTPAAGMVHGHNCAQLVLESLGMEDKICIIAGDVPEGHPLHDKTYVGMSRQVQREENSGVKTVTDYYLINRTSGEVMHGDFAMPAQYGDIPSARTIDAVLASNEPSVGYKVRGAAPTVNVRYQRSATPEEIHDLEDSLAGDDLKPVATPEIVARQRYRVETKEGVTSTLLEKNPMAGYVIGRALRRADKAEAAGRTQEAGLYRAEATLGLSRAGLTLAEYSSSGSAHIDEE